MKLTEMRLGQEAVLHDAPACGRLALLAVPERAGRIGGLADGLQRTGCPTRTPAGARA